MAEHKWRVLPPDVTSTDATRYEVCDCGAKRSVPIKSSAADHLYTTTWLSGPIECTLKDGS